jgi:hypothetical protein
VDARSQWIWNWFWTDFISSTRIIRATESSCSDWSGLVAQNPTCVSWLVAYTRLIQTTIPTAFHSELITIWRNCQLHMLIRLPPTSILGLSELRRIALGRRSVPKIIARSGSFWKASDVSGTWCRECGRQFTWVLDSPGGFAGHLATGADVDEHINTDFNAWNCSYIMAGGTMNDPSIIGIKIRRLWFKLQVQVARETKSDNLNRCRSQLRGSH